MAAETSQTLDRGLTLMTLLADRPTALFTGFLTAVIAGFMAPRGLEFMVFAVISSSVAVYGIGRYRSRQTVTVAGGLIGAASAGLALAMIACATFTSRKSKSSSAPSWSMADAPITA